MTLHALRLPATALLLTGAATGALAQDNPMVGGAEMFADRTIVENAVNSADHETLVAAVQAAGLAETLSGEGPFTVFAPTDDAFAALPDGTVDTLLMPENKEMLTNILTCHVVGAEVFSEAIAGMIADDGGAHAVPTLGPCTLTAEMADGTITLTDEAGNTAAVTIADVDQSNGVIHVIDAVLMPAGMGAEDEAAMDDSEADDAADAGDMAADMTGGDNPMVGGAPMYADRTIVENAVNSADHETLVAAVQQAGLAETLSGAGPFTVFAPTDDAFAALPDGTVDTLMMAENADQLTKVLTAHVVSGTLTASDLANQADAEGFVQLTTVSGDPISVQVLGSGVYVFDESGNVRSVTIPDVMQSNGVIHVVDGVLLPR